VLAVVGSTDGGDLSAIRHTTCHLGTVARDGSLVVPSYQERHIFILVNNFPAEFSFFSGLGELAKSLLAYSPNALNETHFYQY